VWPHAVSPDHLAQPGAPSDPHPPLLPAPQEKRKADEERLLGAISQPMDFHKGKPLAALVIFRACLHWRAFQADRTSIFDRIIQVIGGQIEKQQDENKCLAYWWAALPPRCATACVLAPVRGCTLPEACCGRAWGAEATCSVQDREGSAESCALLALPS
jgi:hypothetical protein